MAISLHDKGLRSRQCLWSLKIISHKHSCERWAVRGSSWKSVHINGNWPAFYTKRRSSSVNPRRWGLSYYKDPQSNSFSLLKTCLELAQTHLLSSRTPQIDSELSRPDIGTNLYLSVVQLDGIYSVHHSICVLQLPNSISSFFSVCQSGIKILDYRHLLLAIHSDIIHIMLWSDPHTNKRFIITCSCYH